MEPTQVRSLGEQLKDARQARRLTLEAVEQATKVRLRNLQSIEEGNFYALPPDVFSVGFVRRYARFLGLDPEVAASMFRRERALARAQRPSTPSFRAPSPGLRLPFVISSRFLISASVVLVVLLLFGYIWYQVRLFAAPPQLVIEYPPEETIVQMDTVTVIGRTTPTANVFLNNEAVPLDVEGGFRQDVKLTAGVNAIEVKAVNRLGKEAVQLLYVLYQTEIVPPADEGEPQSPTSGV